jgi:glycosyltransferase involved in cell wall biosynthesis
MKISVIVASGAGGQFLFRCLESLKDQVAAPDVEVIVVDRVGQDTAAKVEREFPFVQVICTDPSKRMSIPDLRTIGVRAARGEIVAIIEEHCTAFPNWIDTIRTEFTAEDAAIGGPILDDNYPGKSDWVVYFSEYHNYLPPWSDGERYLLNGANIAYKRELVLKNGDVLGTGYWEVVLHPLLAREGRFRSAPNMKVHHTGPFDYGYYLRQRYLLSRVWGGSQREKTTLTKRLAYLAAAPIFPVLLLARMGQRVLKSGHRLDKFLSISPLLIPVTVAYVAGEWLGYLSGVGTALEQVE